MFLSVIVFCAAVFLATILGLPISTTHSLTDALLGPAFSPQPDRRIIPFLSTK